MMNELTKLATIVALLGACATPADATTDGRLNDEGAKKLLIRGATHDDDANKNIDGAKRRQLLSSKSSKNVYGDPLEPCSQTGMAKTGFDRSGQCVDQENDTGSHHICINLASASSNGQDFCQVTGQDDWCAESMPCHEDSNKDCPVENWCVCQWAFAGYLEKAGGCDAIQEIQCKAVNIKAIEAYEADQEKYGDPLACLREMCDLTMGGDDNMDVKIA